MMIKILTGIILSILLVGSIILDVEYSYDLLSFSILLFLTLIIGLFCLSGRTQTKRVGKWLITYSLVVIVVSNIISSIQMFYTSKTARVIITALDEYKSEKREYPRALDELVPKYLHEIPNTSMGWGRRKFFYNSYNKNQFEYLNQFSGKRENFILSYTTRALIACQYTSDNKSWRCVD
ncbi:MAG: hypothetical protein IPM66_14700 [Acidobacteriota bacterium]|nr:MAG: hypothetical protein IPM66_14700 [Acidobacteriota bacterium]